MTTTAQSQPVPSEDDEFITEILARRRRRTPLLTLVLVVALAAAGAFVAGAEAQKHYGHTSSTSNGSAASALAALRARSQRFGGGSGAAPSGFPTLTGGATTGTVTLIKGRNLYVTDSSGNTVIVHTSAASTVTKTVPASVKSILPGDTVTVLGPQGKDGSYTARSISIASND